MVIKQVNLKQNNGKYGNYSLKKENKVFSDDVII
jgi:hypothetical protein